MQSQLRLLTTILLTFLVLLAALWSWPGRARRIARTVTLFLLCAVCLPVILLAGAAGWLAQSTVLTPNYYTNAMHSAGLFVAVPNTLADMAADAIGAPPELPPALRSEARALVKSFVTAVLPPAWLERATSEILTGVLDFLKSDGNPLALALDLREPKAKAVEFLARSPAPAPLLAQLRGELTDLPDQLSPATMPELAPLVPVLARARPVVRAVVLARWAALLSLVVLIPMVWAVAWRARSALRWLGAGCLSGGCLAVSTGLFARVFLPQLVAPQLRTVPTALSALPLEKSVTLLWTRPVDIWLAAGTGMIIAGVLLVVTGFLLRHAVTPAATPPSAAA